MKCLKRKYWVFMFQLQLFFSPMWRMGPRCSSAETQVCHRSYIIAANQIPACCSSLGAVASCVLLEWVWHFFRRWLHKKRCHLLKMLENGQVKIHCSNKFSEKIMVIIYLKKKKGSTIRSFPHSWLFFFVTKVIWRVSLVEQELLTPLGYLRLLITLLVSSNVSSTCS